MLRLKMASSACNQRLWCARGTRVPVAIALRLTPAAPHQGFVRSAAWAPVQAEPRQQLHTCHAVARGLDAAPAQPADQASWDARLHELAGEPATPSVSTRGRGRPRKSSPPAAEGTTASLIMAAGSTTTSKQLQEVVPAPYATEQATETATSTASGSSYESDTYLSDVEFDNLPISSQTKRWERLGGMLLRGKPAANNTSYYY